MNLLAFEKLSKSFAEKTLFNEISFGISENDKVGVIGVNGTGKSTLLKIIAGIETPDSGSIATIKGIKIGYLPQNPVFEKGINVINQIFKAENKVMNIVKEYEEVLLKSELSPNDDTNKKLIDLSQKMDKLNAWELEKNAKIILTKLGIKDFYKDVSVLSGGQKKRVAMAAALITDVDLLILDEPTNHIDNWTIDWLEKYLAKYNKALLMVTHDRYFLDRVVNKIIEIDKGKLYVYQGNYTKFLQLKTEREEIEKSKENKRQNLLKYELDWIKRGAKARTTKQKARIERFEQLSNIKAPVEKNNIEIDTALSRLGKKTIEIKDISKNFDGKCYINHFSYNVLKNDRIGIIGSNGCGKTTLIKIITGQIKPDSGVVEIGETVKFGVFEQDNSKIDEGKRVIDYIKDVSEYIQTKSSKISASQMLEKFLFNASMQWSPISKLSGGEKRRLYLLNILMSAPNILIFDEPTNDLDIETLTILENYLDEFNGIVIIVSHDRYLLDKCINRIFAFENNGKIKQYEGGYSDYIEKVSSLDFEQTGKTREKTEKQKWNKGEKVLKMTFKEQMEFQNIDSKIEKLEKEMQNVDAEISKSETDYLKLQELVNNKKTIEKQLNQAMERWLYLTELNEKIQNVTKV